MPVSSEDHFRLAPYLIYQLYWQSHEAHRLGFSFKEGEIALKNRINYAMMNKAGLQTADRFKCRKNILKSYEEHLGTSPLLSGDNTGANAHKFKKVKCLANNVGHLDKTTINNSRGKQKSGDCMLANNTAANTLSSVVHSERLS